MRWRTGRASASSTAIEQTSGCARRGHRISFKRNHIDESIRPWPEARLLRLRVQVLRSRKQGRALSEVWRHGGAGQAAGKRQAGEEVPPHDVRTVFSRCGGSCRRGARGGEVRRRCRIRSRGRGLGARGLSAPCLTGRCGVAPQRAIGKTAGPPRDRRSEEHTSELQSLMRISYAVFCLKKKNQSQLIYATITIA